MELGSLSPKLAGASQANRDMFRLQVIDPKLSPIVQAHFQRKMT